VSEIAYKLPMNVIADIVGIPVQDRDALFSLANDMLQGDAPERRMSQEEYLKTFA
jgi:cytochrome P450